MSINVTVTGNPISIKRGRMVTSDSYQNKKDFEKRRLMRLEQVRQQSKNIAEDVRNKVRKEKEKQMKKIEEEGKEKLKKWQSKKLVELKSQFEEALEELGAGHKQATELVDENEILEEQKKMNDKAAAHRGQVAASKLQVEKNKDSLKKAIPIQQKKLVRDIENTRAALISNIKGNKACSTKCGDKTKKRKKPMADISITIPSSDEDNSDLGINLEKISEQDEVSNTGDKDEPSTSSCDCVDTSESPRQPLDLKADSTSSSSRDFDIASPKDPVQPPTPEISSFAKQIQERRKLIEEYRHRSSTIGPPLDTRISDRIKRRELMASKPDYCDIVARTHPVPLIEGNTQVSDALDARYNIPTDINCVCGHKCPTICGYKARKGYIDSENDPKPKQARPSTYKSLDSEIPKRPHGQDKRVSASSKEQARTSIHKSPDSEIPEKPPITLKNVRGHDKQAQVPSKETFDTYDSHKVDFYDHPNRFSHEKQVPVNAYVEKIRADSLEVIPDVISEKELQQKMKQRDKEAQLRGQKALEKEKIQRDYEEMLKRLPLLQKKERICEINKDKQEYHMSEDRLKERDRRKQNVLDNAYTKLFPKAKPAIVTLPSKNREKELGQTLPDEPVQSLNVGNWDVDEGEQKMFTADEVQDIVKAFTEQNPEDRRGKLKQLLKSLKLQKEQLINEIKALPSNNSINELISDLKSFSDGDDKVRKKGKRTERKRRREETELSTDSTTESSSSSSGKNEKPGKPEDKHKHKGQDVHTPSPRKKQKKSKRKVLVLQNMSTQTTPKTSIISDSEKISEKPDQNDDQILSKQKPICPKLHIPCDCNKENESTDEVCEIVIKLNENEKPEVVVKSKEKHVTIPERTIKERGSPQLQKVEMKSVGVGTDTAKDARKPEEKPPEGDISRESQKKPEDKSKRGQAKKYKGDPKKPSKPTEADFSKSWREQLSKNSVSTSSTSYFSPPDFQKTSMTEQSVQSLYNLRKKPQQSNVKGFSAALSLSQSSSDQISEDLLAYIEKLLRTSRASIENLTVSTSSVQTPSQSVIEMESNNPLSHLHNLIKYANLQNISRDLSYSPDHSPIYNSTDIPPESPLRFTQQYPGEGGSFPDGSRTNQGFRSGTDKETTSSSARSKDSVLAQYADITDSCSKRIAELAAMIDQIREEKIQMLKNPPSSDVDKSISVEGERDHSTAYLELPVSNETSSKHSSLNSLDDEELQRRLLDIDFSLAAKLKKFSKGGGKLSDESSGEKDKSGSSKGSLDETGSTNKELWSRLNRLAQQAQSCPGAADACTDTQRDNLNFVPFLSDIPKLPKLAVQPESPVIDPPTSHRRPPPSKGLTVARRFNGNITLVPHELSTIIETESQLSTKVGSTNNSRTSQGTSPRKDFEFIVQPEDDIGIESTSSLPSSKSDRHSPSHVTKVALSPTARCHDKCEGPCSKRCAATGQAEPLKKNKASTATPPSNSSSEGTSSSLLLVSSSKKSIQMSSSTSDEVEAVESMLKSIGMEWAIPTLHKTQEALALTSSSSSLELGSKKQALSDASGSEVSLRQYLKKQIKISSSTLKSDGSPASFSGELSELSSIQANVSSAEKSNRRTSTPVVSCKSTDHSAKRVSFSACSDISSVRDEGIKSSKTSYRSLSEYSETKSNNI